MRSVKFEGGLDMDHKVALESYPSVNYLMRNNDHYDNHMETPAQLATRMTRLLEAY